MPSREETIKDAVKELDAILKQRCKSCLNCQHFDEATELCAGYEARPPARVIAYGCQYHTEAVPF